MKKKKEGSFLSYTRRVWHFLWNDDSIWSWIANFIVAFLLIYYIVYPVLGIILGTGYPIVAVISESMEHNLHDGALCEQSIDPFYESFNNYWLICGSWYEDKGITKEQFLKFPFQNGFDKGDVIIVWRPRNLEVGDVLIFQADKPQPIIHRVVKTWEEEGETFYQTKGDHNSKSFSFGLEETQISKERIYGKGILRIPYFGWIKILFVDAVKPLGINIER